jgi:hypothetical protein
MKLGLRLYDRHRLVSPATIYLCQHANRSTLTGRRCAGEVRDGWQGWLDAGLPIERT